ncbi:benzoyl-CoA 2,3-epoxidase subunit BoxA [Magnetospirillum sp. SS-4]|uniref:benzoyl-CoA 2,3-epoxidase subunit BoxA n=1 Tax=Magnetospirillum sp. SS-4 TaxID=2681465 RepID=UPI0013824247|nr:benzoyl-CoA 2,3-epoxidase subunit BoxA [Magnetospirillum sp. SS-4]CAA7627477.1 Benzoyl-CoA oxygenase component A [Magnetospirillum sp. SS-4]
MELRRQHLIDPVVCIRCNTCQEACPVGAITHDANNYVVSFDKCESCRACVSPCPTGAIDNWLLVDRPWTIDEQFGWEELPESMPSHGATIVETPSEVSTLLDAATTATGGKAPAPASAPQPFTNVYSRETPVTARVAGNMRITDAGAESDIRHVVLDFQANAFPVLEGQSIGILPPGTDDKGRPHNIRLYSVASPREGERSGYNNLALTVKRVPGGVGSNYVCDLRKDDEVRVVGPFGESFLMPDDPDSNIVMICTGTGSAPFRAMTERRRRNHPDAPGRLMLFFGARSPGELPYFGPLMKLPKSLIDVNLAFSRVPDQPRQYVQDKLRERSADLAVLLRSAATHIFICGLKGMEQGCDEAFADICRLNGLDWASLREIMRREGRYHVETY